MRTGHSSRGSRLRPPWRWAAGLLAAMWLTAGVVSAASIAPVLVELSPARRVASVTLTNTADRPKTFQAQTLSWRQHDGANVYAASNELFVTPPIAEIPAGGAQIFRIAYRGRAPDASEQAYRLMLEDISPQGETVKREDSVVNLRFRYSLPVFSAPSVPPRQAPRWTPCPASPGSACVQLANEGNRRIRLSGLKVEGDGWQQDVPGGDATVLAGASRQWTFELPAGRGPPLRISARTEGARDLQADLAGVRH